MYKSEVLENLIVKVNIKRDICRLSVACEDGQRANHVGRRQGDKIGKGGNGTGRKKKTEPKGKRC